MTDQYDDQAKEIIKARNKRMAGVSDDLATRSWLREVADEITRLRMDFRRHTDREDGELPASPEAP